MGKKIITLSEKELLEVLNFRSRTIPLCVTGKPHTKNISNNEMVFEHKEGPFIFRDCYEGHVESFMGRETTYLKDPSGEIPLFGVGYHHLIISQGLVKENEKYKHANFIKELTHTALKRSYDEIMSKEKKSIRTYLEYVRGVKDCTVGSYKYINEYGGGDINSFRGLAKVWQNGNQLSWSWYFGGKVDLILKI